MEELSDAMERFPGTKILVVGDLMLDRYIHGEAERVSPEGPVLVLRADSDEVRLGGAASVAALLRGLDAEVQLAGVIGEDASGRIMRKLLRDDGIDDALVITEEDRRTTTKERFLGRAAGRQAHQLLRVDYEHRHAIQRETEDRLIEGIAARLEDCDAILVSDYAKGVCGERLLRAIFDRPDYLPIGVDEGRPIATAGDKEG
jgi:D-beta-D-heptose 7-phosphate kinase/D-beta-D-heptose 1-phosphate adenosyltransferase